MPNQLYFKAKEKLLTAQIDWLSDSIKVALVYRWYTPDLAVHEFLSDLEDYYIVATSSPLTSKTVREGVAACNALSLTVSPGATFDYLIVYKDTGIAATSPLIALIDSAPNLPFTLLTDSVTINFPEGVFNI